MGEPDDDEPTAEEGEILMLPAEEAPPAAPAASRRPAPGSGEDLQAAIDAVMQDPRYLQGDQALVDRLLHLRRLALGADNAALAVLDDHLGSRPPTEEEAAAEPPPLVVPLDMEKLGELAGRRLEPAAVQAHAIEAVAEGVPVEEVDGLMQLMLTIASPRPLSQEEQEDRAEECEKTLTARHGSEKAYRKMQQAAATAKRRGWFEALTARGILQHPQAVEILSDLPKYFRERKVILRYR